MNDFQSHSKDEHIKRIAGMKHIWHEKMIELTGLSDIKGVEISGAIHRLAKIYDSIFSSNLKGSKITNPRLKILMRLYIDEKMGRTEGITPTFLSHMQDVRKNTISSLERGLEDQGLIQRVNDPTDRRIFRLKLTDAGRKWIAEQASQQFGQINSMASDLSEEEQNQLIQLLDKLTNSLLTRSKLRR
jgi:DNA-binding MarR family transcriptional regulator